MRSLFSRLSAFLEVLPMTWLLLLLQNALLVMLWLNDSLEGSTELIILMTSILVILIVQLVNVLSFGIKLISVLFNVLLFLCYGALISYHLFTGSPLDFLLAVESFDNFKYGETLEMAVQFDWLLIFRVFLVLVFLVSSDFAFGFFSRSIRENRLKKGVFAAVGLSLVLISSIPHQEQLVTFSDTAFSYNYRGQYKKYQLPEGTQKYPYLKVNELSEKPAHQSMPNVFVVILESCNASYLESTSEDGVEFMPFMNSLIPQGLYIENFYSNSIFTGKGHFSILTGTFPSITQSVFSHFPDLNTQSIADALKTVGYRSTFFHGYHDLTYGGALPYYKAMNFDLIKQMDSEFITASDLAFIWGWGLQDDKFFQKYFDYLDREVSEQLNANQPLKPLFSVLGTMSHHYDFKSYPKDQAFVYPDPKTDKEYFANSIYLEDLYLRTFFDELSKRDYLDNSIVILVGDHGFPSEGLGVEYNGNFIYSGYQEDRFRTPMLILYPGHIKPQRIKKAYSQIDIAPTILDLLNIKTLNAFQGQSMMDSLSPQHTVHLVQPYDGLYIASLLYPYKYVYREHTGEELLFHLENDPGESRNLMDQLSPEEEQIVDRLRSDTREVYFNQKLIEGNRIWPN